VGSIEQGKWANVLLLDQELAVQRVFLRGNEVTNLA
jgi:N-acetylglucosamine-6-phosphate deacetylase